MKAYNVELRQMLAVMDAANQHYGGNLDFARLEQTGKYITFTLRVKDSKGPGHRRGHSGKRMTAACWHAHRDFMRELFGQYPQARIVSAMESYNGKDDFDHKHNMSRYRNIGSLMVPLMYGDACDC